MEHRTPSEPGSETAKHSSTSSSALSESTLRLVYSASDCDQVDPYNVFETMPRELKNFLDLLDMTMEEMRLKSPGMSSEAEAIAPEAALFNLWESCINGELSKREFTRIIDAYCREIEHPLLGCFARNVNELFD